MLHATDAIVSGHYSSQCLSKTVFAASQDDMIFGQDSFISEEQVANHCLDAIKTSQESPWSIKFNVDSQEVIFLRLTWVLK